MGSFYAVLWGALGCLWGGFITWTIPRLRDDRVKHVAELAAGASAVMLCCLCGGDALSTAAIGAGAVCGSTCLFRKNRGKGADWVALGVLSVVQLPFSAVAVTMGGVLGWLMRKAFRDADLAVGIALAVACGHFFAMGLELPFAILAVIFAALFLGRWLMGRFGQDPS